MTKQSETSESTTEQRRYENRRALGSEWKKEREEAGVHLSAMRSILMQPTPTSDDMGEIKRLTSRAKDLLRSAEIKQVAEYSLSVQEEPILALWILHTLEHQLIPVTALSVALSCPRGFLIPRSWTGSIESVTAREHLTKILEKGVEEGYITRHVETFLICNDCGATIYSQSLPDVPDESGAPYRATIDALKEGFTTIVLPKKWEEWACEEIEDEEEEGCGSRGPHHATKSKFYKYKITEKGRAHIRETIRTSKPDQVYKANLDAAVEALAEHPTGFAICYLHRDTPTPSDGLNCLYATNNPAHPRTVLGDLHTGASILQSITLEDRLRREPISRNGEPC